MAWAVWCKEFGVWSVLSGVGCVLGGWWRVMPGRRGPGEWCFEVSCAAKGVWCGGAVRGVVHGVGRGADGVRSVLWCVWWMDCGGWGQVRAEW